MYLSNAQEIVMLDIKLYKMSNTLLLYGIKIYLNYPFYNHLPIK